MTTDSQSREPQDDWIDHLPGITGVNDVHFGELMVPLSAIRSAAGAARAEVAELTARIRELLDAGIAVQTERGVTALGNVLALLDQCPPEVSEADPYERFVADAGIDMLARMREGQRRGWGVSWTEDYTDAAVTDRLTAALRDLFAALLMVSRAALADPDPRLDAIRERVRRADGLLPQAVADRAYLLRLVDGEHG